MTNLMTPEMWKLLPQFGFGIIITALFFFLLKWVLKQQDKILDRAEKRDTAWQDIVSKATQELDKHTNMAGEFHSQVREAHNYQREEHKEICQIAGKQTQLLTEAVTLLKKVNGNH